MSTIQVKGSYKIIQNFIEKGFDISSNNTNNQILKLYYQHLISLENKKNTITTIYIAIACLLSPKTYNIDMAENNPFIK